MPLWWGRGRSACGPAVRGADSVKPGECQTLTKQRTESKLDHNQSELAFAGWAAALGRGPASWAQAPLPGYLWARGQMASPAPRVTVLLAGCFLRGSGLSSGGGLQLCG